MSLTLTMPHTQAPAVALAPREQEALVVGQDARAVFVLQSFDPLVRRLVDMLRRVGVQVRRRRLAEAREDRVMRLRSSHAGRH